MRLRRLSLLLCVLVLSWGRVGFCATSSDYTVRSWQSDDGLPQNYVQAVLQDRTGYLWIGTQEGVSHFDGLRFTWSSSLKLSDFATAGSFLTFAETSDGSVWMGLEGGRVVQCRDGLLQEYGEEDGLPNSSIRAIEQTEDGTLWFGSNHGLLRRVKDKFELFTAKDGLPNDIVRALCQDRNGRLWIGTDNGLSFWEDGRFQTFPLTNGLPRYAIRALYEDHAGTLWIGMHGGLMRLRDGESSLFVRSGGHSENMVTSICEDERGALWIGSYNGLSRFANGVFESELKEGKSYELVYCINKDRDGNIWVGTKDGLHRLSRRHFTLLTKEEGLPHNNITSLREDRQGNMWIGTWGGGLCLMAKEAENGAVSKQKSVTIYNSTNGLGSDFVMGLGEGRDSSIWIGTPFDTYGLKQFKNGKFIRYGKEDGFADMGVRVIEEDEEGNLWIGTEHALSKRKDGVFTRFTSADGLSANGIRSMHHAIRGTERRAWFGTDAGLTRLTHGKFFHAGYSNIVVNAFFEDRDGHVWFALWGIGLVRTFEGAIAPIYSEADGFPTPMVQELLQDDAGGLWISSRRALYRLDKGEMNDFTAKKRTNITSFPLLLGNAEGNSVAKPSAWKRKNGELWFATSKGVAIVKPNEIRVNSNPPPVVIEALMADKKPIDCHAPGTHASKRNSEGILTIPPGRGELEFHYTALSYTAPEKSSFRYKLEGADAEWIEAGSRRIAFYNNLSPGNYSFRVIASNNDGVWNEQGDALTLVLQPYFWQTRWFTLTGLLGAVGLIAGSTRFITRKRMQGRLARLEQQHAIERERTRIARDMHDDLGANLTEILVLSTLTRDKKNDPSTVEANAGRIAQRAEGVIDSLHAIVWAINPKNDSLDRLVNYICEQAQSFLETSSIRCRLEAPTDLPPLPVSSDTRHNIFLAVKEALNNIVKHANASEVHLQLVLDGGALRIVIQDNGRGFEMADASSLGNGLQNMEKRLHSIDGSAEFSTSPGTGTTVRFRIPLSHSRG